MSSAPFTWSNTAQYDMPDQTPERAFETYVEEIHLTCGGWKYLSNSEWVNERALFPAQMFAFIQDTQPKLWAEMRALHAAGLETMVLTTLVKELDAKGSQHMLRHGFGLFRASIPPVTFRRTRQALPGPRF